MKKLIITLAAGALIAGNAVAAVNVRQLNQDRRIDAGVRSGKLTRREAANLKGEERYIVNLEKGMRARHGGHLTDADKAIVHAKQDRINQLILGKKNNRYRGKNHLKV